MMSPDRALAVVFSYIAVACLAWTHGYLSRVWVERRRHEGAAMFVDLTDRAAIPGAAYNWQADGECIHREIAR